MEEQSGANLTDTARELVGLKQALAIMRAIEFDQ